MSLPPGLELVEVDEDRSLGVTSDAQAIEDTLRALRRMHGERYPAVD